MIKVGIVGGTGYTGSELLRLLVKHPHVQLTAITSRTEAGKRVDALFSNLRGWTDLVFIDQSIDALTACDVVFYATPHGVAMSQARELLAAGVKIIDLAADFRLKDVHVFEQWYGMPHACADVLAEAVYGLPELNRSQIKQARVIGNPGCYPTTVQLALLPLLKNTHLVDMQSIIVDAKSGISGAGRKAEISLLAAEASDNFKAYGVLGHRHHPEIAQGLRAMTLQHHFNDMVFMPHLVPMIRGMLSTIYIKLTEEGQAADIHQLFCTYYKDEPCVDVLPYGQSPETRSVRGSNVLRIGLTRPEQSNVLVIFAAQDNLVKGASGQAIQNMNIMFDLPETMGLDVVPLMP